MQTKHNQSGNALIIILAIVAVLALGGLGYMSTQIGKTAENTENQQTAMNDKAEANDVATSTDAAENTPASAQAQTEIKEGNPVVATVNNQDITRADVFQYIQTLPAQSRQLPLDQLFPMARDQVINARLIDIKTDNVNLDNDPEVQQQLAAAKEQIVKTVYIQNQINERLTDAQIEEQYEQIVENTPEVDEVKASHILVEDEETAKEVVEKLIETGDFESLAQEYSKDATASNGGSLGYFTKADVVPEFGDVAFDLEPGIYTKDPVKTQFGYHIIRVEDKRKRKPPTMEEAKPFIEAQLRQKILNDYLKEWQETAEITRLNINGEPDTPSSMAEPASGDEAQPETP